MGKLTHMPIPLASLDRAHRHPYHSTVSTPRVWWSARIRDVPPLVALDVVNNFLASYNGLKSEESLHEIYASCPVFLPLHN